MSAGRFMRRAAATRLLLVCLAALARFVSGDVVAMTWNMKWFPSGVANLKADAGAEERRILMAGGVVSAAYHDQRRKDAPGLVLLVQEVRDAGSCRRFAEASGISGLKVVAVSEFLDPAGVPYWQQQAVLSTLPVVDSGFAVWAHGDGVSIPRGFAYALLDAGADGKLLCFSLHLKSNRNDAGTLLGAQKNIYKREAAAAQVLALVRERHADVDGGVKIIVGGDFNTNEDNPLFVSESTLRSFYGAHFRSCFRDLKRSQCVTWPGRGGLPDSTFDYVLYRGFDRIVSRRIYPGSLVSDHNLVAIRLRAAK